MHETNLTIGIILAVIITAVLSIIIMPFLWDKLNNK